MAKREEIVDAIRLALVSHIVAVTQQAVELSEAEVFRSLPITYGGVVQKAGISISPRGLGPYLTELGNDCAAKGVPRLDYLVINKKTRMPGFRPHVGDWRTVVSACSRYPWIAV